MSVMLYQSEERFSRRFSMLITCALLHTPPLSFITETASLRSTQYTHITKGNPISILLSTREVKRGRTIIERENTYREHRENPKNMEREP